MNIIAYPQSQSRKLYRLIAALLLVMLSLRVAACDGPSPNSETFGKTFPIMLAR